jgi:RNA polymerase sigma-70 factor (ECF subfamily)
MTANSGDLNDVEFRDMCRRTCQMLIERYDWSLATQEDLLHMLGNSSLWPESSAEIERLVKSGYIIILYEACRQQENLLRREQGFKELFRYLYRAAYNRWPDIAEDITQQALLIVYEQIERCREPAAFLAFALNKLRGVVPQTRRLLGFNEALVEAEDYSSAEGLPSPGVAQEEQERVQTLLDAIQRLPTKQQQSIILKYFGGLSDEVISERLGITISNVRVMRHRAILQLGKDSHLQTYFE